MMSRRKRNALALENAELQRKNKELLRENARLKAELESLKCPGGTFLFPDEFDALLDLDVMGFPQACDICATICGLGCFECGPHNGYIEWTPER